MDYLEKKKPLPTYNVKRKNSTFISLINVMIVIKFVDR